MPAPADRRTRPLLCLAWAPRRRTSISTTAIPVNDDVLAILGGEGVDPARALQEAAVLDLYRRAVVSAGQAAELLGMAKWDFVGWAGELGVAAVRMSPDEFEDEIAAARADLPRATTR